MDISEILAPVTSLVYAAVQWTGQYVEMITSNPLLLLFVLTGFVGLGIGIIRRLISL